MRGWKRSALIQRHLQAGIPRLGSADAARERGFGIKTAIMDGGYDSGLIHDGCMNRGSGISI